MTTDASSVEVRNTRPEDFAAIIELCRKVYPESAPWKPEQLGSHVQVFPEGQFVAIDRESGRLLGIAASLIVNWDDYEDRANWREFTASGMFTNHDPVGGRTLYAAEVMVDPASQGRGIGKSLYRARRQLARRLGLSRIRAGARLRGYHRFAETLTPEQYVGEVVAGRRRDATLSFQLAQGFQVFDVVGEYLSNDPESLGYAALIEWANPAVMRAPSPGRVHPAFARQLSEQAAEAAPGQDPGVARDDASR